MQGKERLKIRMKNKGKQFQKAQYRVRQPVLSAASSSLVLLRRFFVQHLTIRSYTHWDGNLILAKTGQEGS